MTPLTFNANSPELLALKEWWDDLGKSPGPRAELRRCGDLQEAALATGTQDLCLKLKCVFGDLARVGAIAALASHIKEKEPRRLAEAFAGGGEDPALSELRFRRLIQCRDREELFPLLRRALHLLGGKASLEDLAHSLWFWNDRTRQEWTFIYYRHLAPGARA
jgi:CRISPR system Cascade subunit CasB